MKSIELSAAPRRFYSFIATILQYLLAALLRRHLCLGYSWHCIAPARALWRCSRRRHDAPRCGTPPLANAARLCAAAVGDHLHRRPRTCVAPSQSKEPNVRHVAPCATVAQHGAVLHELPLSLRRVLWRVLRRPVERCRCRHLHGRCSLRRRGGRHPQGGGSLQSRTVRLVNSPITLSTRRACVHHFVISSASHSKQGTADRFSRC